MTKPSYLLRFLKCKHLLPLWSVLIISSCGPGRQELEQESLAREQAKTDSVANLVETWKAMNAAMDAELIAELQAAEARRMDSRMASEVKKTSKPKLKKHKKEEPKTQTQYDPGNGEVLMSSGSPNPGNPANTEPAKTEETKPAPVVVPAPPLENYNVVLTVDSSFKTYETGELRVWIGAEGTVVKIRQGQVQDSVTIPARLGQSAKITPFAPGFTVAPAETQCIEIDPSGSEVRFMLTPNGAGTWKVSADIKVYNTPDCSGVPVPKSAATLTVVIEVDHKREAGSKLGEMGAVVWEKFMSFWGALVTLVFGSLLYFFRKKFKSKTGFDEKEQ
ncbi:MAG: hypothetical protein POELPBGB_03897 [Bacteroidia bacterium]|nr:hypothetical protein [Bacteroidia bacterium]